MRLAIITSSLVLLGTVAHAGSIEPVTTLGKSSPSQLSVTCEGCTPLPKSQYELSRNAPKWKPSDSDVVIKEVDGVKKRFSKEAWFGGSPVIFVTKEPGQDLLDTAAAQPMPGVDAASTTAALTETQDVDAVKAGMSPEMDAAAAAEAEELLKKQKAAQEAAASAAPESEASPETGDMKMRVN